MSTIFDYLKEVTYDSIYDRPFKELDVLALTELTYLPFYTEKAPAHLVEKDKADLAELEDKMAKVQTQLAKLGG